MCVSVCVRLCVRAPGERYADVSLDIACYEVLAGFVERTSPPLHTLVLLDAQLERVSLRHLRAIINCVRSTLTSVDLSHTNVSKNNLLIGDVCGLASLTHLTLLSSQFPDNFADSLRALCGRPLLSLEIAENELAAKSAAVLAELLGDKACALTSLNVSFNRLGDDGARLIACALATNRSLKSLNLRDNEFGASGVCCILDALASATAPDGPGMALECLDLGENFAKSPVAPEVTRLLTHAATLRTLNLSGVELAPDDVQALVHAVSLAVALEDFIVSPDATDATQYRLSSAVRTGLILGRMAPASQLAADQTAVDTMSREQLVDLVHLMAQEHAALLLELRTLRPPAAVSAVASLDTSESGAAALAPAANGLLSERTTEVHVLRSQLLRTAIRSAQVEETHRRIIVELDAGSFPGLAAAFAAKLLPK